MAKTDLPQKVKSPTSRIALKAGPVTNKGLDQRVRFYPSGQIPSDISPHGLWVKTKDKPTNTPVRLVDTNNKWLRFDAPDREVILVKNGLDIDQDRPIGEGFDKFVTFSSVHKVSEDRNNDRFLINPFTFGKRDKAMGLRDPKTLDSTNMLVLSDSSGFQLRSGLAEWVDPTELAAFYSHNVDEGMTLDIPCGGASDALFQACAEVQSHNSKYLKQNVASHVDIFNVIHGIEVEEMIKYRSYTEKHYDSDFACLSVPSSMNLPPVKQLDRMAYVLSVGKQYPQYHMLGLSAIAPLLLVVRLTHKLANMGRDVFVTADSSAFYYQGKRRVSFNQMVHYETMRKVEFGSSTVGGKYANQHRILPCSCHVCANIKYVDIMSHIDKWPSSRFFVEHSEWAYSEWLSQINLYAKDMSDVDYYHYCLSVSSPGAKQHIKIGLQYIEDLLTMGFWKTHKKYKHITAAMFSMPTDTFDGQPVVNERKETVEKRLWKAVKKYREWHDIKSAIPCPLD